MTQKLSSDPIGAATIAIEQSQSVERRVGSSQGLKFRTFVQVTSAQSAWTLIAHLKKRQQPLPASESDRFSGSANATPR
jgi:hypothetical protein